MKAWVRNKNKCAFVPIPGYIRLLKKKHICAGFEPLLQHRIVCIAAAVNVMLNKRQPPRYSFHILAKSIPGHFQEEMKALKGIRRDLGGACLSEEWGRGFEDVVCA